MKKNRLLFLMLNVTAVILFFSCAGQPKPVETDPVQPQGPVQPAEPVRPQGPGQALLDGLDAAEARARDGREAAVAVTAEKYFPDEWNKAESDNNAGKNADKNTSEGVERGIALFTSAAEAYEALAANAGPLLAKETEDANSALKAAIARTEKSRKDALDNEGPKYFPDDWANAETARQNGLDAKKDTLEEIKAAAAIFSSAADGYDVVAGRGREIIAKEKEDADKALREAASRAEKSRQAAVDVNGQSYFPNDWKDAEAKNASGKNAKKTTPDEIKAATALFDSAASAYDDIAGRSRQRFAKDAEDANKALQAATARAEKSRQAAVSADAQTYLPNDWKNAETKNASAKNAKKGTPDEIKAATALFVSAADAYDDVTRKSQQQAAKEKDDANKALQAAIARAEKSRKAAQDAKANVNLPGDWNAAEAKNTSAKNAKRGTAAEMKAAAPLYVAAADAYDELVMKNTAFLSTQNRKPAEDAKARAETERRKALDVKADVAAAGEFGGADAVFKQALSEFDKKVFASAAELYNKSADQFAAAVVLTENKRARAGETVEESKKRSAQSADFAVNTGIAMEEKNESI